MNKFKNILMATFIFMGLGISGMVNAAEAGGYSPHAVGLFLGRTQSPYETENTYGLEYEYRFSGNLGAGLVMEETGDAHHGDGVSMWAASVYYHQGDFRLGLGMGKEKVNSSPSHSESLTRLSASYDFHVGGIGLAPTIAFDRVDGHTIKVWGLTIMKTF